MSNPTPKELAAMVEAMTAAPWTDIGTSVTDWDNEAKTFTMELIPNRFNEKQTPDARGIVALRNHFVALMERYERMRTALEAALDPDPCRLDHHGNCQAHGLGNPCEQSLIRAALADADKPLESRT